MSRAGVVPPWLLALLFAALVLYTDDYVIAGVLPEVAAELDVSEGQAGQLVTVFSVTVAVVAPVAAFVLARVERRVVFAVALAVFVAANAAAALTPSFAVLIGLRVLAALAAAAATPSLFAVAAARAPEGAVGRYVAVVSFGVTGAIALGVPVGTWVGGALDWRATFGMMAGLGLVALVLLVTLLPRSPGAESTDSLGTQLRALGAPAVSLGLLANALLMTGSMMLLTYLAPFLSAIADVEIGARGAIFALSGAMGIVGIWAGGRAADAWGADRTLTVGILVILGVMGALAVLWPLRPVSLVLVGGLSAIWGGAAFWNAPAVQVRLHALAGPLAPQALALNTSATYVGVGVGGAIGGALLSARGPGALLPASMAFCAGALVVLTLAVRFARRRGFQ